jgi:hypothetical protein
VGVGLALYVFMLDAIHALRGGGPSIRELLPVHFNWALFLPAVALMAAPVIELAWLAWRRRSEASEPAIKTETVTDS